MYEKRLSFNWGRENALHPIGSFSALRNFGREHLTLSLAGGRNKMRPAKFRSAASGARMLRDSLCLRNKAMDTTTLLIIVVIVLLLGGGGFYGRGRWW